MSKRLVILVLVKVELVRQYLAEQKGYEVFVSDGGPIKENYIKELHR